MDETNTTGNKMNPMMIAGIVVVIAVVGFFLMTKSKNNQPATEENTETTNEQVVEQTATDVTPTAEITTDSGKVEAAVKTITMEAGSFYYKPNVITVKKGEKVKVVMTAKDMMHNFNIDEFNVKSETVKSGTSTTFEFTASKTGTFEYYCAIGKHRQNGQVGKLIVE